jgi:hypothetical protein
MLRSLLLLLAVLKEVLSLADIKLKGVGVESALNIAATKTLIKLQLDPLAAKTKYLIVSLDTQFTYDISAGERDMLSLRCSGQGKALCVLNLPSEEAHLNSVKGYRIEILLGCTDHCHATATIEANEYANIRSFDEIRSIYMDDVKEMRVQLQGHSKSDSMKVRFEASAFTKTNSTNFFAFVNKKSAGWPDAQKSDFRLKHIHQNKLANIIYQNDANYCIEGELCDYRFLFNTENLFKIDFSTSFSANPEKMQAGRSYVIGDNPVRHLVAIRPSADQRNLRSGAPRSLQGQRQDHVGSHRRIHPSVC